MMGGSNRRKLVSRLKKRTNFCSCYKRNAGNTWSSVGSRLLLGNHWKIWKLIRHHHTLRCLFCGTHHVSQRRRHCHNGAKNITPAETALNANHTASCHLWLWSNTRLEKKVTRTFIWGAAVQEQVPETSFMRYWMNASWVLERCAPQFENHWTNLWMA